MAIRRSVFQVTGLFDDAVGRVGNLPAGCDETELCIRLVQRMPGAEVVYAPAAAVDHFVPRARQTLGYFSRRCFHEGRSKRKVSLLRGAAPALSVERDYVYAVLPRGVMRGLRPRTILGSGGGLLKSATIVWGLAATVSGFAYELLLTRRGQ